MSALTVVEWYKGNTKRLTINVKDSVTGADVPLTSADVAFAMKNKRTNSVVVQKDNGLTGGITLGASSFTVALDPNDTDTLPVGDYDAQAKVTFLSGDVVTVAHFIIRLKDTIV